MEIPGVLSPDQYQAATSLTAQYEKFSNPLEVLRHGLGDEMVELIDEAYGVDWWDGSIHEDLPERSLSQDTWQGELGDMLWYVSEIARYHVIPLSQVVSAEEPSTDFGTKLVDLDLAHVSTRFLTPKYDFAALPVACLGILVANVDDALHSGRNWEGKELDVTSTLRDLCTGITVIAKLNGLDFDAIARSNLEKLAERSRKPHTITYTEERRPSTRERRRRMWLATLVFNDN